MFICLLNLVFSIVLPVLQLRFSCFSFFHFFFILFLFHISFFTNLFHFFLDILVLSVLQLIK
ncbi:hypothetical protein GLOIN_2v1613669, partial [Rhizophagus irregularis DAOM 181602=DAOM 197198]